MALVLLLGLGPALAKPVVVRVTAALDKTYAGKSVPCRAEALNAASNECTWSVWEMGREVPGVFTDGVFHAPKADTTRLYRIRATSVHDGKASDEATIVVLPLNEGTSHLFTAMAETGWSQGYGGSCSVGDLPFFDTETWIRYDAKAKVLFSMDPARATQVVGFGLRVPFRWDAALADHDGLLLSFRNGASVERHNGTGQYSQLIQVTGKVRDCYLETLAVLDRKANEWYSCLQSPDLRVRGMVAHAGNPGPGFEGDDDGQGLSARFRRPMGLAMLGKPVEGKGVCVVADTKSHVVREVHLDGDVKTRWGTPGEEGLVDGPGTTARFRGPTFLAAQPLGNNPHHVGFSRTFVVSDTGNHAIRVVDDTGVVTTLAGTGQAGFANADNPREALFNRPMGVALDKEDNVFVADAGNRRIRQIDAKGKVTTLAGSGAEGFQDGQGEQATFTDLRGLCQGPAGLLFVVDGNSVRVVTPQGAVTTLLGQVGTPGFRDTPIGWHPGFRRACLNHPSGIASYGDHALVIADEGNHAVRTCSLRGMPQGVGAGLFVKLSTLAGDPEQKAIRFGLLRDGLGWTPTEDYAALADPLAVVATGTGGFFVTTGHSVVELAEAELERRVTPFCVLDGPGHAAGHGGILRAKAGKPLPLTLQWFDGGTTPPSFTWTATCAPRGGGTSPVKLAEGDNQGRNLVGTEVTFPQPGIMELRLQCVTEQGITEHSLLTVIVDK